MFENSQKNEPLRKLQQGRGRPIISEKHKGYQFVATGNEVHYSKNWRTFPDFLAEYLNIVFGAGWFNEQREKQEQESHPLVEWEKEFIAQRAGKPKAVSDGVVQYPVTGVVNCYLGLSYNLYLLKHNVELQERLVSRLKNTHLFQGAYYETIVANCLIRAGFELALEDEDDQSEKHCEFSVYSPESNTRYWVEAKTRGVLGVLGKNEQGGSGAKDPTSRLTHHLNNALKKTAHGMRMIFVDLNTAVTDGPYPAWADKAVRRIEAREKAFKQGEEAYLFVTNFPFHLDLSSQSNQREALAHGFGLSDFGKPGQITLAKWYKNKQKHRDAHNVITSLREYPNFPDTFDGRPPSEAFNQNGNRRLVVGNEYFFEDAAEGGILGRITSVAVLENEKNAYVTVTTRDNKGVIVACKMSDAELDDYRRFGDDFFGQPNRGRKNVNDVSEFYEFLVECYKDTPKEKLLEFVKGHPSYAYLEKLEQFDLALSVCEMWAASFEAKRRDK